MSSKLTGKVKPDFDEFIRLFVLDGCKNAVKWALKAGYAEKAIDQQVSRLLKTVKCKKAIEEHQKTVRSHFIWTKEEKLLKLQQLVDKGIETYADMQGNSRYESLTASINAIKEHNVMQGDNAPEQKNDNSLESAVNKLIDKLPN